MRNLLIIIGMLSSLLFSQWEPVNFDQFPGRIAGFHMTDTLNITAVYQGGTCSIIKSSDGGRNWSISQSVPLTTIDGVDFVDENNIYVRSSAVSSFFRTTNAGATWTNIALPAVYNRLNKFQFFDSNYGYACVSYGSGAATSQNMIKTTDGGTTWRILDSTITYISDFKFKTPQVGWIIGSSVQKTTNGCASFTALNIPAALKIKATIDMISDSLIIVGGGELVQPSATYFYYVPMAAVSTNGGISWVLKQFSYHYGILNNLKFINETSAVSTIRESGGMIYTTDKGATWGWGNYPEKYGNYLDLQSVGNRVYLSGEGSIFLASGDQLGQKWDLRLEHIPRETRCATSTKSGKVFVGAYTNSGHPNKLYYSSNKGINWTSKLLPGYAPTKIIAQGDSLIYITDIYNIYRTDTTFESFDSISSYNQGSIHDFEITSDGHFWICSQNNIVSSSDNGQTWETKLSEPGPDFYDIHLFDDGTGYANNRSLYKTTDHGNTWSKIGFSQFKINDIEFYDSKNGFLIGDNKKVYRTRNGGFYFDEVVIPGMVNPSYIFCNDSLNFFLSASNLYSTYDGGWMWKENQITTSSQVPRLQYIRMFDHFEGVALGYIKGAWITHNRGNTPVELSLFSALAFGNKVVLQWTTETETNNMGFEIERKYKYGDWKKIAFSKGSGTSTRKIFYGYDDYEPKAPAILYYRLKQIDYNGEFEYSNEVEVIYGEVPENYSIQQNYPNPFNPSTKVTFSLPEENKVVIRVFNAMGEQVKEIDRGILSHGYFEQDFEMGTESSGMYFCQVLCTNTISGRTKSLTVKMVLMK